MGALQKLCVSLIAIQIWTGAVAQAETTVESAREFRELLATSLNWQADDARWNLLHLLPTQDLEKTLAAPSLPQALALGQSLKLSQIALANQLYAPVKATLDADEILRRDPITIVIVPGVFGEFIANRPFEEVFSEPSRFREEFRAKIVGARVSNRELTVDESFELYKGKRVRDLEELVNVGSIRSREGQEIARAVLFYTPEASLESLGRYQDRAVDFTRRLEKYLKLTGPQKLVFVGYSRGTVIALEMLARARQNNAAWLSQTQGLVSLGGVVFGSALADDSQGSVAKRKALAALIELRDSLQTLPDSWIDSGRVVLENNQAWSKFVSTVRPLLSQLNEGQKTPSQADLQSKPIDISMNPKAMIGLALRMGGQLGLLHAVTDYSNNIRRFQAFTTSLINAINELRSDSRLNWWKSNDLPENLTYYTVAAALSQPEQSDYENFAFNSDIGYSKKSYDDRMLLQNALDYTRLSGLSLNDSQVSVPQCSFLPEVMRDLQPGHGLLKTKFLGIMGTHHWGLALKIVNPMRDGRTNPFPRAALLKALAAQASLDSQK